MRGIVFLCTALVKRGDEVEEQKYSTGAKLVENLIDARDGEPAKDAEFVQLLENHREANATGFLRDGNHWARPGRCGVLDEAGGEEYIQNRVHLLCGRGIEARGPRRDRRAVRGTVILKGSREQEPKSVGDFENTSENSARTSPKWVMTVGVQPRPRKSNAISRMCDGKRLHACRKRARWSVLNRSSSTGEGR